MTPVNHRHGDVMLEVVLHHRQGRRGRGQNHPGNLITQQRVQRLLQLLRVVGIHQQRHQPLFVQGVGDRAEQAGAERAFEPGRDHPDKVAVALVHGAGDQIHLIAQRLRGGQHLVACVGRNAGARRERARNRRTRHPGVAGHIVGGD